MSKLINFGEFTVDNGAIRDLNELLFTTTFENPDIEQVLTVVPGAENGKKLGWVDSIEDVGTAGAGCNPTYTKANIVGFEKQWDLGDWEIPKQFCYKDLTETLAKYGMKPGTYKGDLQDTPYWDQFLIPLLQKAVNEMFWRVAWFGDKNAKNIAAGVGSDGGILTAGVDPKLFTMCDGLWKRLEAIIAANSKQQTAIEANNAATYDEQKTAIRKEGVAIDIVDQLLTDADGRIDSKDDATLFMTSSFFKALRANIYKRSQYQLTEDKLMNGILVSQYDGKPVVVLDIWDRMIKKYEDNGKKLHNPHRVVYTSPKNLFVGTSDTDLFGDFDVQFDHKARQNYIYASSDIGTLVGEDDLVQVAI